MQTICGCPGDELRQLLAHLVLFGMRRLIVIFDSDSSQNPNQLVTFLDSDELGALVQVRGRVRSCLALFVLSEILLVCLYRIFVHVSFYGLTDLIDSTAVELGYTILFPE